MINSGDVKPYRLRDKKIYSWLLEITVSLLPISLDPYAVPLFFILGLIAGTFGGLLGIGGGFLITPSLVLFFNIPIHNAVAISLVCVTMTSLSATLVYASRKQTDFRYGILLETVTVLGSMLGARIAIGLKPEVIEFIFGAVLSYASIRMIRGSGRRAETRIKRPSKARFYLGMLASFLAGMLSSLVGIGGGTVKVPIMYLILGLPVKTSIATSAFMIGITSSTGALVYLFKGLTEPTIAAIIVIGVFLGAQLGSRLALRIKGVMLRKMFGVLLFLLSIRMILKSIGL
ncbi:MAG: sulfite exporter TauE/SafE family protein [Thermoprotei archaeon]|nr:MAG: sulfite exporter TauE/SafE family protein [Thermoprotei archaeon]